MKRTITFVLLLIIYAVTYGQITEYPYSNDFEGSSAVDGWSVYDDDGDGNNWNLYSGDGWAHSGSRWLMSYSWNSQDGALNPDNYLFTPDFIIPDDGGEYMFGFYHRSWLSNWLDNFGVYVIDNADRSILYSSGLITAPYKWTYYEISLDEYSGKNIYIIFRHYNSRDNSALLIDDISVFRTTPLPITLLYFTVTETDCGNLLEWATATERHNAGFSLMRSPDAMNWDAFAWKPTLCDGNSTTTTEYSYMDTDIRWDTTYYKFIQYDSIWSQTETYYPESSEIIVAMRQGRRAELPNIMYDGGCILLVAGSTITDAYAYDTTGRLIYDTRLKPHATARLVVRGNAIVEFLWVENGELMKKSYKVGCWY